MSKSIHVPFESNEFFEVRAFEDRDFVRFMAAHAQEIQGMVSDWGFDFFCERINCSLVVRTDAGQEVDVVAHLENFAALDFFRAF